MRKLDTSKPSVARMYDYYLGGKDNFAADRAAADKVIAMDPEVPLVAWNNRAFMTRAVHYLAGEAGIRQFLDVGTGIPTRPNLHETAQAIAPESRVVYVDNDNVVLRHAEALLTSCPEGMCAYVDADLRDTGTILAEARKALDFAQPVALMLVSILHFIPDADDPHGIVARLVDALPDGSYLTLTHVSPGGKSQAEQAGISKAYEQTPAGGVYHREEQDIRRFFDGLSLVSPGLTEIWNWRPAETARPTKWVLWGGVAVKKPAIPQGG